MADWQKQWDAYLGNKLTLWEERRDVAKKAAEAEGDEWNDEDFEKDEESDANEEASNPNPDNPKPTKPRVLGGNGEDEGILDDIVTKL